MPRETILLLGISPVREHDIEDMHRRCGAAAECWRSHPNARIIACGGKTAAGHDSEAEEMRRILQTMGVSDGQILCEDASIMTMENIQNALALLDGEDKDALWLVSSDYHMPRARKTLKRCGVCAREWPAYTPLSLDKVKKSLLEIMYTVDLLLGYQDRGAHRPAWTKALMRLMRMNKH